MADKRDELPVRMDTGLQAWFICFTSFLTLATTAVISFNYGLLLPFLKRDFSGHLESQSILSLPGSLCIGVAFFGSFFNSIIVQRIGLRRTASIGSLLSTLGLLVASFAIASPSRYSMIVFTLSYGVLLGIGFSLIACPTYLILTHYFDKKLGIASALSDSGTYVFNSICPMVLPGFVQSYGLSLTLKMGAGLVFLTSIYIWTFVERPEAVRKVATKAITDIKDNQRSKWTPKSLKNSYFLLWLLGLIIALVGQSMTNVHLVSFAQGKFPENNFNLLMSYIFGGSFVGRFLVGWLSDLESINVVTLQALCFISNGGLLILYVVTESFQTMVILSFVVGLCTGGFYGIRLKVMLELIGAEETGQVMGIVVGSYGLPYICGPTLAGIFYDLFNSYSVSFVLAGLECAIGAMLLIPVALYLRRKKKSWMVNETMDTGQLAKGIEALKNDEVSETLV